MTSNRSWTSQVARQQPKWLFFRFGLLVCAAAFSVSCSRQPEAPGGEKALGSSTQATERSERQQRTEIEAKLSTLSPGSDHRDGSDSRDGTPHSAAVAMVGESLGEIAGLANQSNSGADVLDDPSSDGWETEVFSAAAGKQLKHLCELLDDPSPITEEKLLPIVTKQVTTESLRPEHLETVFQDALFKVQRLASPRSQLSQGEEVVPQGRGGGTFFPKADRASRVVARRRGASHQGQGSSCFL